MYTNLDILFNTLSLAYVEGGEDGIRSILSGVNHLKLVAICHQNDPNGVWLDPDSIREFGSIASHTEMVDKIIEWVCQSN